jgi:hypothetical protein
MGVKRIVDSAFWTDAKVDTFSPEDKYFMLYLLSNPFSKQLGIYEINTRQAAFQMGYSEDAFRVLLDRFETKYRIILFSKETSEVAILNFLRHSILKGGKPVEDCIKKEMDLVKNRDLIEKVFRHLRGKEGLNATVTKIINEYFALNNIQNDIHNDIDNDNDNERIVPRIVPRIVHDSSEEPPLPPPAKPDTQKEGKKKCGEYKHVLLKKSEFDKLVDEYGLPRVKEAITFLDEYIEMKGYKAKSHYLAIQKWVFDALDERDRKKNRQSSYAQGGTPLKSSFDTDDFFEAALAQSYGGAIPTAADDESIRERAEELKGKLGQM